MLVTTTILMFTASASRRVEQGDCVEVYVLKFYDKTAVEMKFKSNLNFALVTGLPKSTMNRTSAFIT